MSIELKVYDNGDHTCLVWLPQDGQPIPGCRGFSIRRFVNKKEDYLHGFVGFRDSDKFDPAAPWKFPVQRFLWWDYAVKPGDAVQYSVVPVIGSDKENLILDTKNSSPTSPELKIAGHAHHAFQLISTRVLSPHNGFPGRSMSCRRTARSRIW
jgi:hypothetical protein